MSRRFVCLISIVLWFATSGPLVWGQDNQILNPEFDNGLTSWLRYGASGYTVSVVSDARLSGPNAALMDVTDASVTSIGLAQGNLKFERGKKYPVGVMAKADKPREMVILIQLSKPEVPSWTDIVLEHVSLTTEPQTFLFEYTHNDDNMADHPGWAANLYLMLKGQWWPMTGDTVPSKVWVDRVHVGPQPALADVRMRTARTPQPANNAVDVPRDTTLTWVPGDFAGTHDVYLGKTFVDVNTASRDTPKGVQVSLDQAAAAYTPAAPLEYGQTYYWRIDEVNKAPDNTIFKGNVWSFTVEPYSYPLTGLTATASTSQPAMGPEKTIDGSGMTGDLHGTGATTMWMTMGVPPNWIQYQFDAVYKLDKLLVWNSNQAIEAFIGFGAKDVTVEYSMDGTAWTALAGVPPFAQGTGSPGYAANTTIDFAGVTAKYVKLTINKSWGGLPTTGLAEVRFLYIPLQARAPQPATKSTGASLNTVLNWRPGRDATSHKVYLGTDPNAVANSTAAAQTVTNHNYTPGLLNLGSTYYWKVDEVGTSTIPGSVWSFTTQDFALVEDFEAYNDDTNRIFDKWIDGFDNPKANGAIVGKSQAPFAERVIIHGGSQSLPLYYDNTGAPLSEATLTLDQNWAVSGIKSLSLYFRGVAGNKGQLYVKINKVKVAYTGAATDIAQAVWQPWNIDLSVVGASLSKVTSLTIGIEGAGAKGTLYVDDIRLYPKAPEFIVPVQPNQTNLVARWTFDGNYKDSVGTHHGTAFGDAKITTDTVKGQVLNVDGNGDGVDVPYGADLNPSAFTVSLWANPSPAGTDYRSPLCSRDDLPQRGYILYVEPGNTWQFWTGTGTGWDNAAGPAAQLGEWAHVSATFANNQKVLYLNGRQVAQSTAALSLNTQRPLRIGGGATESVPGNYFFRGLIDDVRLYNRALSNAEVAGLSGRTEPLAKPF